MGSLPILPGHGGDPPSDNPDYMLRMLKWAEGKPKVKAMISFDNGRHKLAGADTVYPNSGAALSEGLKGERWLGDHTAIESGLSYTVNFRDAAFEFSSAEAAYGQTFQCSLDGSEWKACSSPVCYSNLPS